MATKTPIPAGDDALDTRSLLLVLNGRLAIATIAGAVTSLCMAAAIITMLPLKEKIPYIVEVSKTGEAYVPHQALGSVYSPTQESRAYFLRRWVKDAFTINQFETVQKLDPRARIMLRGANAINVYNDWLKLDGKLIRLANDPTLIRDVEILAVTPIAGTDGGVLIDTRLTTRKAGKARHERRIITVYYDIFPLTEKEDVEVNPLGIFITDFKVGENSESWVGENSES